jgi:hypothetical protein
VYSDGNGWLTADELESDVLNNSKRLDLAMIRACKKIVALILIREKDVMRNGLTLKDAIMPSYEECSDITAYCREYVLKMGVCAEGAHVDLGILPSALRIESHIIMVPRERSSEVNILHTQLPAINGQKKKIADVHLLFRPGHYDLLYTGKDTESISAEFTGAPAGGLTSGPAGTGTTTPYGSTPSSHSSLPSSNDSLLSGHTSSSLSSHSHLVDNGVVVSPAALAQLMSILSISSDVGERLLKQFTNNVELATDYYFNNLHQFQSQHPEQNNRFSASAKQSQQQAHQAPAQSAHSQSHHQQQPSNSHNHHTPAHQQENIDDRILASAVSQYPYLGQAPIKEIIVQSRAFGFPVKIIIDSIVVYNLRSVKDIVDFCQRAITHNNQHAPPAPPGPMPAPANPHPSLPPQPQYQQQPHHAASPPARDVRERDRSASPCASVMSDDRSLSSGLGKESDMINIRKEQQQFPELGEPHLYGLVHQLVVGLGYRLHDVCTVIGTFKCRNVFSVLKELHCQAYRRPNDFIAHNHVVDDDEDCEIVSLIGNAVAMLRWDKLGVVDSVVFDYCKTLDEIEDVRKCNYARKSIKFLTACTRLSEQGHTLSRDDKLLVFDTKLEGLDRAEIVQHIRKMKIPYDESLDAHISTTQLRNKLRSGVFAKMERLDLI